MTGLVKFAGKNNDGIMKILSEWDVPKSAVEVKIDQDGAALKRQIYPGTATRYPQSREGKCILKQFHKTVSGKREFMVCKYRLTYWRTGPSAVSFTCSMDRFPQRYLTKTSVSRW